VTAALRVGDELADALGRGRALDGHGEGDFVEGGAGTFETELVGDIEATADIDPGILDGHIVERREPRHLGQESERRSHQEVRERRGPRVFSAPLGRLVGFEAEPPDRPFQMHVLDDSGHYPLPADLVINAAPGVAAPAGENGARYLLGPRFALLRREFAGPVARDVRQRVGRLFLILGGATPSGLVAALARVARQALPAAVVDLVVGPAGDDPSLVVEKLADLDGVNVHAAPESVRPLMLGADLAITGGGFTLFELAATGTPALGVELAPNQRANLAGMVGAGTLVVAGKAEEAGLHEAVGRTLRTLALDVERRRAMSQRGLALVDGRGAVRVAEAIRARLAERRPDADPAGVLDMQRRKAHVAMRPFDSPEQNARSGQPRSCAQTNALAAYLKREDS